MNKNSKLETKDIKVMLKLVLCNFMFQNRKWIEEKQ